MAYKLVHFPYFVELFIPFMFSTMSYRTHYLFCMISLHHLIIVSFPPLNNLDMSFLSCFNYVIVVNKTETETEQKAYIRISLGRDKK